MKKIFYLIIVVGLLISCSQKEKKEKEGTKVNSSDVIPSAQMQDLLIDVLITESAVMSKQLQYNDADYYTIKYYNYVLKNKGINSAKFSQSLDYYAAHTEEFSKIMANVVDSLSSLQSRISNE